MPHIPTHAGGLSEDQLNSLAQDFHENFVIKVPNFRDRARWEQEAYAANYMKGISPSFAKIEDQNSPAYRYYIENLLERALPKTTGEEVQSAAETFGPPALAMAASAIPGGGFVARALQAGLGGATGEFISQLRPFTTGEVPPPISVTLKEAGKTLTLFPLADVAAQKGILEPGAELLRRGIVPFADEPGRQLGLQAIKEFGGVPSITQRGGGGAAQFVEAVSSGALFGRGIAQRRQETVEQAVEELTRQTLIDLRPLALSSSEAARRWIADANNVRRFLEEAGQRRFESVVKPITDAGAVVNTSEAVRRVGLTGPVREKLFSQFEVKEVFDPVTKRVTRPGFSGEDGFVALMNSNGPLGSTLEVAQQTRSAMLRINRQYKNSLDPTERKAADMAGLVAVALDDSINSTVKDFEKMLLLTLTSQGISGKAARAQVPEYTKMLAEAKSFWKQEVVSRFENELYGDLVNSLMTEPAKLIQFARAANSVDQLKVIRRAAPRQWGAVRGEILKDIINKAVVAKGAGVGLPVDQVLEQGLVKRVSGASLVQQFKTLGDEYTNYLLGQKGADAIRRLGAALDVAADKPRGTGGVAIALTQAGPAMLLLGLPWMTSGFQRTPSMGEYAGAAMLVATPALLSKMLSTPWMLNLLERGIIGGPKTKAFARLSAFMTADLLSEAVDEAKAAEAVKSQAELPSLSQPVGPALSTAPPPALPPPLAPPQLPPPALRTLPPPGVRPF